jgi:hypothetical protein
MGMTLRRWQLWRARAQTRLAPRAGGSPRPSYRVQREAAAGAVDGQDPSARAASRSSEACSRLAVVARARGKRFLSVSWVQS